MGINRKGLDRFILSFFVGALVLSVFSLFQKKLLGVSLILELDAFIVPILFGGFSGLAIIAANTRLRASQERLQDFLNSIGELIQIVDPDGKFLFVNRAWTETLGYTREEASSLTLFDIIHPDHLESCKKVFHTLIAGEEENAALNTIFLSKKGEAVYLDGKANANVKNDRTISTRTIFRDITAEQEALEFKNLAANIFENNTEGLVIVKPDFSISYVNRAFTQITGYTKEESLGKNVFAAFPRNEAALKNTRSLSNDLIQKGYWKGELWTERKGGELYPIRLKNHRH